MKSQVTLQNSNRLDSAVEMATSSPCRLQREVVFFARFAVNYAILKQTTSSVIYCSLSSSSGWAGSDAPADMIHLTDNVTADLVGRERYRRYFLPVYDQLHTRLEGTGKLIVVHTDRRLGRLEEDIAQAKFDAVEAFTPPPEGDLPVREARKLWPGKALWLYFPGSVDVASPEMIEAQTGQLVEEAGSKRGFAISTTEDAPYEALEKSLSVNGRALRDY